MMIGFVSVVVDADSKCLRIAVKYVVFWREDVDMRVGMVVCVGLFCIGVI
jgi:hypothetical protein